jgi:hypothetical protein
MPLPIIADVFRCVLNWTDPGAPQGAHNVLHFKTSVAGRTPLQVFTCLDAHVTQAMWDFTTTNAFVTSVGITKLDGVSAAEVFGTGSPAKWQGGGTGSGIPQVAGVVKLATGLRGPANRGRIFLPFVGEGEYANGTLIDVVASTNAWVTAAAAWIADATTPMALGIASYKHSNWHQVVNLATQARSRTLGRRLRRV